MDVIVEELQELYIVSESLSMIFMSDELTIYVDSNSSLYNNLFSDLDCEVGNDIMLSVYLMR